jgi:hypothetical protein
VWLFKKGFSSMELVALCENKSWSLTLREDNRLSVEEDIWISETGSKNIVSEDTKSGASQLVLFTML